ncbi:putative o-acetylhomoserine sulfhydrylase [Xylariaceae sp. AK1471]|nr:putative o-acetylhomoserine sulfhydrylase [Xylariaceae sp. AK1471]
MPRGGSISDLDWVPDFETVAVRGGQEPDPGNGYVFEDAADGAAKCSWNKDGYLYTRLGNPTNSVFEKRMAMLEGGVGAVAMASGHSAQFMAVTQCCEPGHNIVSTSWLYGGTFNQFRVYLPKFDINVKLVLGNDPADFDAAIDDDTRAVYIETVSNPKQCVPDIPAIAAVAHKHDIPLMIDNTFGMAGYLCQPIKLGADIVMHSCTKWIGGHNTSMGGVIIDGGRFEWGSPRSAAKFPGLTGPALGYHGMKFWETYGPLALTMKLRMDCMRDLGPCMSPFNAWLFLQGLETLPLRAQRTVENTQKLAVWLEAHPCVNWVLYPGLRSHPDFELARKLMPKGTGGVLTFGVAGKVEEVRAIVDNLKMCSHVANVGDCKTLIIHPWVTTHQQLPDEEKNQRRYHTRSCWLSSTCTADLLRVSVGIENIEDIKRDFEQAFAAAGLRPAGKVGDDPFNGAMDLVNAGFMGTAATSAPKAGVFKE